MKINLFIHKDQGKINLINFFQSLKKTKFIFQKFSDLKLYEKQKNLLICGKDISLIHHKKILLQIQNYNLSNLSNLCIFLPLNMSKQYAKFDIKKIYYPINIFYFEQLLLNLFITKKFFFKNLELLNDNNLVHIKNNKQVRLTEIESKIIKLLFNDNLATKIKLNSQVLNQRPDIESKSLESHLYRLRKKLLQIDDKIQIISHNNKSIKII